MLERKFLGAFNANPPPIVCPRAFFSSTVTESNRLVARVLSKMLPSKVIMPAGAPVGTLEDVITVGADYQVTRRVPGRPLALLNNLVARCGVCNLLAN
jgi:hypothetical protein